MKATTIRLLSFGMLVFTAMLMAIGCDSGPVSSPPDAAVSSPETQSASAAQSSLRFTGRDSFGVAFKATISGTARVEDDGRCSEETVVVSGSGQATHLGRVHVEQSHCLDPSSDEITDGHFTYTGRTGAEVSGTYESVSGEGSPARIRAEITGTTLRLTQGAERIWGTAWIPGLLPSDGPFSYRLDGYLAFI